MSKRTTKRREEEADREREAKIDSHRRNCQLLSTYRQTDRKGKIRLRLSCHSRQRHENPFPNDIDIYKKSNLDFLYFGPSIWTLFIYLATPTM